MKLKRIVFSKKDNRDETDKKWDSALGSVLGAAGGSSVGTSIGKVKLLKMIVDLIEK